MQCLDIASLPTKDPFSLCEMVLCDKGEEDQTGLTLMRMVLSTASKDGRPSSRFVALKDFDRSGLKFTTDKNSMKAKEMFVLDSPVDYFSAYAMLQDSNPHASVLIWKEPLQTIVKISGKAQRIEDDAIQKYWPGVNHKIRMLHISCDQGEVLTSREELCERIREKSAQYTDVDSIPASESSRICVYNISPEWWEFYSIDSMVPDRIVFRRPGEGDSVDGVRLHQGEGEWVIERLAP